MMTKLRRAWLPQWLLASIVSVLMMLLALPAAAGTVQIRDPAGLLSSADASALRAEGTAYPFDVRVVTSSEFDKKSDFDRYVGDQVSEPNMVVVGLDRVHRFTSVHFGTGLGVPPAQYRSIEQAGSPHFRESNWRAGIEAILGHAKEHARGAGRADAAASTAKPKSLAGSTLFIGLVVVMVVAAIAVFVGSVLSRRAAAGALGPPGHPGNMPPGGYPPGAYPPGGPYPPGQYGPGYGGGSGIGGTIASAGLGGLVGYQLGKMAGDRAEPSHESERGNTADVSGGHEREDFDAGGSTDGWDDQGGGGGGGGDWGGGDGGDSGGGGDW